jgi:hypothetical protein
MDDKDLVAKAIGLWARGMDREALPVECFPDPEPP